MRNAVYTPPSGPPNVRAPQVYARVGAEALYGLAWAHYRKLQASAIGDLFPEDEEALREASRKQAEFWFGVTGGPPLYVERHGPPRMRARHLGFAIDASARREWMRCMREAMGDGTAWGFTREEVREWLCWLEAFSGWMVNRRG